MAFNRYLSSQMAFLGIGLATPKDFVIAVAEYGYLHSYL